MPLITCRNWETSDKLELLDHIAEEKLGIALREWQRLGTAQLLSGKDVLLLIATGSGKSIVFYLYALVRPRDIVLVISPLKLLQKDMVSNLEKRGLSAVALNEDSISIAHEARRDLWGECAQGDYQVVLCSPEQLDSSKMRELIGKQAFQSRVSLVVVDEAHLIPIWGGDGPGPAFRSAYNAIGTLRSRLQSGTVFLGLSATLMPGNPIKTVRNQLGFNGPKFSLIQRDCERTNLHITMRRIEHSYTQSTFADLDWLVPDGTSRPADIPKSIVYVDLIMRGHALATYLRSLLPTALRPHAHHIICHLYASTCPQCRDEASAGFLKTDDDSVLRIIVATEAFGCGVDIPDVAQVINFGTPRNLCTLYQRFGRAARHLVLGFCYVYVHPKLWDAVLKALGLVSNRHKAKRTGASQGTEIVDGDPAANATECCRYFKQVLESHLKRECINNRINILYANPVVGKPNPCLRCSGCIEDKVPPPKSPQKPKNSGRIKSAKEEHMQPVEPDPIPHLVLDGLEQPSKKTLEAVQASVMNAARNIWLSVQAHKSTYQLGGLRAFLPSAKSSLLANRLLDLQTPELVHRALGDNWPFWDTHGEKLATQILEIRSGLISELQTSYRAKKSECRATQLVTSALDIEPNWEGDPGAESEDLEESQPCRANLQSSRVAISVSCPIRLRKRRRGGTEGD